MLLTTDTAAHGKPRKVETFECGYKLLGRRASNILDGYLSRSWQVTQRVLVALAETVQKKAHQTSVAYRQVTSIPPNEAKLLK